MNNVDQGDIPKRVLDLIAEAKWHKTTYIRPHEYVLANECPELHKAISELLVTHGYDSIFYKKTYHYVKIGEYTYWIIEEVLNREHESVSKE